MTTQRKWAVSARPVHLNVGWRYLAFERRSGIELDLDGFATQAEALAAIADVEAGHRPMPTVEQYEAQYSARYGKAA